MVVPPTDVNPYVVVVDAGRAATVEVVGVAVAYRLPVTTKVDLIYDDDDVIIFVLNVCSIL